MSGRLTPASLEAVQASAPTSSSSCAPTPSCARPGPSGSAAARSTRSARRRSTSTRARRLYHCHGCGVGGDAIDYVRARARARLHGRRRVAGRALQRAARVRGAEPRGRGPAARRGSQARAPGADRGLLPPRPAREPAGRGRPHVPDGARRLVGDGRALPARLLGRRARRSSQAPASGSSPTASSRRPASRGAAARGRSTA